MAILTVGSGKTYDNTQLQTAIDAAGAGDVIQCSAGETFTGTFTLKNKGALASYITITTNAAAGSLPAAGVRTSPAYVAFMPTIQSAGAGASTFLTEAGANHYKLQHLHLPEVPQGYGAICAFGANDATQTLRSQQPDYITVDQCYIHGGSVCGQKRAFQLHLKHCTISNNYVSDIKSVGQDSQCIQGNNGEGPYLVTNNRFSAGTTPILFGGSDPWIVTRMTVAAAASSTGARVACSDAGHTLAELSTGQVIAGQVAGTYEFATIDGVTGAGSTGAVSWTPAFTAPIDSTGALKAGIILGDRVASTDYGCYFARNHVLNDPTWINKTLGTPVLGTPSTSAVGTLSSGAHYYQAQAFSSGGYQGNYTFGDIGTEVSGSLTGTGKLTMTLSTITGATVYRVWRGTTPGGENEWTDSTGTTFIDDGTLSWTASGTFGGQSWQIKNLFEIKAAQNCLIEANIFENCWKGSDVGFAWWLKTVNQDGDAVFLKSKNLTLSKNIVRHVYGWLEVHGTERGTSTMALPAPMDGLTISNTLLYDSGSTVWGQGFNAKYCMDITEGAHRVTVDHNTLVHTEGGGWLTVRSGVLTCQTPVFTNNLGQKLAFGIHDNDGVTAEGTAALAAMSSGSSYTFLKNALSDASSGSYPSGTFCDVSSAWQAQFVAYTADGVGANYRLNSTSAYALAGTDGKDLGADIVAVLAATATVQSGAAVASTHACLVTLFGV